MPKTSKKQQESVSKWLTITLRDGSKKQLRFRGATEKEALAKVEAARAKYQLGSLTLGGDISFAEYAEEYLEVYVASRTKGSNADLLVSIVRKNFNRVLGDTAMNKITRTLLQRVMNTLEGKSKSLIDKSFMLLRGIFSTAYDEGIISYDPMRKVLKPDYTPGGRRELSEAEHDAFMEVFENSDHQFRIAFALCLGCGLRPGEVRALSLPKIDTGKWTVTVDCAVKMDGKIIGEPKTKASYRTVPVPVWLQQPLQDLITAKVHSGDTCLLLWHGADNKPISEQRWHRGWESYLRLMDLAAGAKTYRNRVSVHSGIGWDEITPYYLRHTFATDMMQAGVDIKTAMEFMGHSNSKMLLEIYSHVNEQMRLAADEKLAVLYQLRQDKRTQKQHQTDTAQQVASISGI